MLRAAASPVAAATSIVTLKASGVPSRMDRRRLSRSAGRSSQVCSSWRSPFDSEAASGTSRSTTRMASAGPAPVIFERERGAGALAAPDGQVEGVDLHIEQRGAGGLPQR